MAQVRKSVLGAPSASAVQPPPVSSDELAVGEEEEEENIANFAIESQPLEIQQIFQHIDTQRQQYINELREAVAIRSISTSADARNETLRMTQWFGLKLRDSGFNVELRKMGDQTFKTESNSEFSLPKPPVIFATLGNDENKKTLLIYGHIDVLPAKREDWESEPFLLSDFHGQLHGRGATDDKGPLLGWIHAIQAYQQNDIEIPINIKLIVEGMEECGSEGLAQLLSQQRDKFLANVDFVCISDNYWLGKAKPCLTYGLRGLCYFFVQVECGTKDLHSGVFGGNVYEALPDLMYLLNQLQDADGNILIPGVMDDICPKTLAEEELYSHIDFNMDEYQEDMGVIKLRGGNDKVKLLMNKWRYPSLSLHGIQGAFHDPGARTVIPRKVIGKFSIRLVPNQTPEAIESAVISYLKQKWEERGSPNKFMCFMADDGIPPWSANPSHPSFKAARRAIATVYQTFPDMIREGGFMHSVLFLQEVTGKCVVLLPMGSSDDAAHFKNEKLDTRNYVEGTKVMASYFWELGKLKEA